MSAEKNPNQINRGKEFDLEIAQCAGVLHSYALGRSNFIETEKWTIGPYNGIDHAVEMTYHPSGVDKADFAFLIFEKGKIVMENQHRRAHMGSGVTAFSYLEHMAKALSKRAKKRVQMVFPLYGQVDTEAFLLARGYLPNLYTSYDAKTLIPALAKTWYPFW